MIKFKILKSENEETHHFIMKPEKPRNEANQALEKLHLKEQRKNYGLFTWRWGTLDKCGNTPRPLSMFI